MVVGKHPKPNVYCIKPVNGNGPEQMVNLHQLQDLGQTQNDGGHVPSFNPKPMNSKTPPISHQYATRLKGRPPMHSLSTTTSMGSSGLRPAQPQRVTFCSRCIGNSFWIWNHARKYWSRSGSFFYLFIPCGQHQELAI